MSGILFFCDLAGVGIILEKSILRVGDHGRFHMKPSIAEENYDICFLKRQFWRCAAQYFSSRARFFLRNNQIIESMLNKFDFSLKKCRSKLYCAHQIDGLSLDLVEVELKSVNKVLQIDLYLHKNIKNLAASFSDGDQAAVSVMDEQVAAHSITGDVINAAGSISDISHDDCTEGGGGKCSQNVTYYTGKHHKSLWKLKRNTDTILFELFCKGVNTMQCFLDLEIVVTREDGNSFLQLRIIQVFLRDSCHYFLAYGRRNNNFSWIHY